MITCNLIKNIYKRRRAHVSIRADFYRWKPFKRLKEMNDESLEARPVGRRWCHADRRGQRVRHPVGAGRRTQLPHMAAGDNKKVPAAVAANLCPVL